MPDDLTPGPYVWYTDEVMLEAENERDPRAPYEPDNIPGYPYETQADVMDGGDAVGFYRGFDLNQPWFLAASLVAGFAVLFLLVLYS